MLVFFQEINEYFKINKLVLNNILQILETEVWATNSILKNEFRDLFVLMKK